MIDTYARKPRMAEKIMDTSRAVNEAPGQKLFAPYGFILNYSNKCNFRCPHCYTNAGSGTSSAPEMTLDDIKHLADQADELGVYELDVQGGEPLLLPNLFDVLETLGTERFYTYITTNGWLMTQGLADKLAAAGVDRISVSIDAFSAAEHDKFRRKKGSFDRAIKALEYTEKAGMQPNVNIVVGRYNAQTKEFEDFCEFLTSRKYGIVLNCATPTGDWKGNFDAMLIPEDTAHLVNIRKTYKRIIRDLWNYFDLRGILLKGCPAVNLFYVNPSGDVIACPYIQTKLGNIKEQPLRDILEYGFSYKQLNTYSSVCLAGEDRDFAMKYLNQETSILDPMPVADYFNMEDATT